MRTRHDLLCCLVVTSLLLACDKTEPLPYVAESDAIHDGAGESKTCITLGLRPNPDAVKSRSETEPGSEAIDQKLTAQEVEKPHDSVTFADAIRLRTEELSQNPTNTDALIYRGQAYLETGQFALALDDFNELLSIKPGLGDAHNGRSAAFCAMGKYDEALLESKKAIENNADPAMALLNRGNVLKKLRRFDEAIADFDEAIRLDPRLSKAYINRAGACMEKGNFEDAYFARKALQDLNVAIRIDPNHSNAHMNRALVNMTLGNFANAIEDAEKTRSLDPTNSRPLVLLELIYRECPDENLRDSTRASEISGELETLRKAK